MAGKKKSKKKMGLTSKIFISLIAGAILGVILHYVVPESYIRDTVLINGIFYVVGNGFLRLMQMLVVPLVFCSLICGSAAIGDTKTLGKVGVKTLGFYMLTTALAVVVALSLANVINPGIGLNMSEISAQETTVAESGYAAQYHSEKPDSGAGGRKHASDYSVCTDYRYYSCENGRKDSGSIQLLFPV